MTASTVKSTMISNFEATPQTFLDRKYIGRATTVEYGQVVATTSIDEQDDKILTVLIPSNARVLDIVIRNDDLDSHESPALAVDVGLFYSGKGGNQAATGKTSGTVVDQDLYASAITTLQAANKTGVSVRYEAESLADFAKPAWEAGGLSADPGGHFYIGITVTTAAATAAQGSILVTVTYLEG